MLVTLIILSLAATASLAKNCPEIKGKADFDMSKLAGTWYEVESTQNPEKLMRKCLTYVVEAKGNNKLSSMTKYYSLLARKVKDEYHELSPLKSSDPATLQVTPIKGTLTDLKWTIVFAETDYDTFAIGWSCFKFGFFAREEVVILSRTKTMTDKQFMDAYALISKHGMDTKKMTKRDHNDKDCEAME